MKTIVCFCVLLFCLHFQEEDSFNQINLVVPGSLLPVKKEVAEISENEKQKLFRKEIYAKVFRNIRINAIFKNRSNLKNLVVKTKIA